MFAAGYATLAEGLKDLGIAGVELWVKRDDTVAAIQPVGGKTRLNLNEAQTSPSFARRRKRTGSESQLSAWETTSIRKTSRAK